MAPVDEGSASTASFGIEPLSAPLGAEVHGLPVGHLDEVAVALRAALDEHRLLLVRDGAVGASDIAAIAAVFGGTEAISETHADGTVAGDSRTHGATPWQADGSFLEAPPIISLHHAMEVPNRGGQTQFADMAKVLGLLPPEDRDEIAGLQIEHRSDRTADPGRSAEHPWIQASADGTSFLYMGAHAQLVVGRDLDASRRWFDEIEAQIPVHDVFYEHRWSRGDLIIHDSRRVMHRTLGYDVENERRIVRTITVAVPPPKG